MKKNFGKLAVLTALLSAISFAGCGEDGPQLNGKTCDKEGEMTCNGVNLETCIGGLIVSQDCTKMCENCTCLVNACLPAAGCDETKDAPVCSGNILSTCSGTKWVTDNCENSGKICKDGACVVDPSQEQPQPKDCDPACTGTQVCENGQCVDKGTPEQPKTCDPACTGTQVCENGQCVDKGTPAESSGIGDPCSCVDNCEFEISFADVKPIKINGMELNLAELLKEPVKGPNFLGGTFTGCEKAQAQNIPGATIACLYDYTVKLPSTISNIMTLLPVFLQNTGVTMEQLKPITDLATTGIQFTSPQGYCVATAINIEGSLTQESADLETTLIGLLNEKVKPITTGDSSKFTSCPADSELIKFDVDTSTEPADPEAKFHANFKVGFSLCAKKCTADTDCRESYKCTTIPSGDGSEKRVCFDQANIDRFSALDIEL